MKLIAAKLTLLAFFIVCASAQNTPLSLKLGKSVVGANTLPAWEIKNESSKEVIAFVLISKEGGMTHSLETIVGQSPGAAKLMPGNSMKLPSGSRGARLTSAANPTLDLVIFADGTTWGNDAFKKADYIKGKIDGAALERKRQALSAKASK